MIFRYGVGALSGYVRLNNLTIGSATSGATERANADTQALFNFLWGVDSSLAVSGGRGATSAADWSANKQLSLPDWRGYGLGALDDMGNSAAGRLTASYFGAVATVLGAVGGGEYFTLAPTHIPVSGLSVSGTTGTDSPDHTHGYTDASVVGGQKPSGTGTSPFSGTQPGTTGGASTRHTHPFSANLTGGGGQPLRTIGPRKLCTFYMKL
jgi:hypothetical protein